jgi:hypothetical protein
VAVGSYFAASFQKALVENWNGHTWSVASSRDPSSTRQGFSGVSCPTTTNCFAVGAYTSGATAYTLVEHWDGSSWTIVPSPNPTGSIGPYLSSIACPSTTDCYAVGSRGNGTDTLVEHWDGKRWSIMPSPSRAGSTFAPLLGVACHGTSTCFAVGDSGSFGAHYSPGRPLIEQWNGNNWSIMNSPNPHSQDLAQLANISCTAATSCFAVATTVPHTPEV